MTLLVLIPCPLGYCLFVRLPHQRLRTCSTLLDRIDLRDTVRSLGCPLTVVLVGRRRADEVSDAVLEDADLVIVPEPWLRRVPRTALFARAEMATRIATAHRSAQVEERLRNDLPLALPF